MKFLKRYFSRQWGTVLALVAIAVLNMTLFLAFNVNEAVAVIMTYLEVVLVMLGVVFYITYVDSPNRWPGITGTQRLGRLFSFKR